MLEDESEIEIIRKGNRHNANDVIAIKRENKQPRRKNYLVIVCRTKEMPRKYVKTLQNIDFPCKIYVLLVA